MNDEKLIMGMMAKLPSVEERELLATLWLEHSERKELTVTQAVSFSDSRQSAGTQQSLDFRVQGEYYDRAELSRIRDKEGQGDFIPKVFRKGEWLTDACFLHNKYTQTIRVYIGHLRTSEGYKQRVYINIRLKGKLSPKDAKYNSVVVGDWKEDIGNFKDFVEKEGGLGVFVHNVEVMYGLVK